jgi:ParB family chromosome partitioning protein
MAKVALGKGLGALINKSVVSPTPAPELGERVQPIVLSKIIPSPLQPRTEFRDDHLKELVESIREHGIIQPLIVRLNGDHYELIAGERRWRAAKEAGLAEAPVIVRTATDLEVLELAIIENIQREDLNPIEEAMAYARLAREFGLKQEEIAQKVGKSRAGVANCMRLLELAEQVRGWLTQNRINVGHAKVLLAVKSHEEQTFLAEQIIRQGHTVRAAEKLVASHLAKHGVERPTARKPLAVPSISPSLANLQNRLQQHFATHVTLQHGEKKGRIEIEYYGLDDLNRLLEVLKLPSDEA